MSEAMTMPATPLTALYVPGDRPDRFAKAAAAGADAIVIDLEDAITVGHKERARGEAARFLATAPTCPTVVRINGVGTPWHADDVAMLAECHHVSAVRLPKVDSPQTIDSVRQALPGMAVQAVVESARGVENLLAIAEANGVASVSLGEADLRSELGITAPDGLDWVRTSLVIAARAANLAPPMMSVFTDVNDLDALDRSSRRGKGRGFVGRAAIHPRQIPVIERAFLPTDAEIDDAHKVLAALSDSDSTESGVAVLPGGRMVDAAARLGAERTMRLAARTAP